MLETLLICYCYHPSMKSRRIDNKATPKTHSRIEDLGPRITQSPGRFLRGPKQGSAFESKWILQRDHGPPFPQSQYLAVVRDIAVQVCSREVLLSPFYRGRTRSPERLNDWAFCQAAVVSWDHLPRLVNVWWPFSSPLWLPDNPTLTCTARPAHWMCRFLCSVSFNVYLSGSS